MMALARALALASLPALVFSHGAMVTPRSRNSVVRHQPPTATVYSRAALSLSHMSDRCARGSHAQLAMSAQDWKVNVNQQRCSNVTEGSNGKCENGQASFWYSQGCFIGCPTCDNESGRRQTDLCGLGKKQTLTDVKYWSVNRDAVPFSDLDIYQHNPWRAPGSAPVADAWYVRAPSCRSRSATPSVSCTSAHSADACLGRIHQRPRRRLTVALERRRSRRLRKD